MLIGSTQQTMHSTVHSLAHKQRSNEANFYKAMDALQYSYVFYMFPSA